MQRYMSIGTSFIVALMAAHRAVSKHSDATPAAFDQTVVASINLYLANHAHGRGANHAVATARTETANECEPLPGRCAFAARRTHPNHH